MVNKPLIRPYFWRGGLFIFRGPAVSFGDIFNPERSRQTIDPLDPLDAVLFREPGVSLPQMKGVFLFVYPQDPCMYDIMIYLPTNSPKKKIHHSCIG